MKYKLLFFISFIIIISIYYGSKLYTYYSPAKKLAIYQTIQHNNDTLRIAFIGDSWALGHQYHKCLIPQILTESITRPVCVESYGIGGLTSKEIYKALFEIDNFRNFMKNGYDYCIISAGINDTHKKMSTSYYQNSMDCIIRFLLTNNIHPIILEIPDYNILKVYDAQEIRKKIIRRFSMFVNNTRMDCKQQFRDALDEMIRENEYQNEVSIIRYKSWNDNYSKDLGTFYNSDQVHLNEGGFQILDSAIAHEIYKHYSFMLIEKQISKRIIGEP